MELMEWRVPKARLFQVQNGEIEVCYEAHYARRWYGLYGLKCGYWKFVFQSHYLVLKFIKEVGLSLA
jgi:hypothetical protein